MSNTIKGTLSQKLTVDSGQSKAGKEWKKQGFVIDTGDQYNPNICFNLFGDDKIKLLENFAEGEEIEVSFNLSSREFNGRYYHNLDAWKIESVGCGSKPKQEPQSNEGEEQDDLPFNEEL